MIAITPAAVGQLRGLIKHSRGQPGLALKLISDGRNGITMTMGQADESDVVIRDDGAPILIIASALASRLDGLIFDWLVTEVNNERRGGFSFRPAVGEEIDGAAPPDQEAD
jgi:Fe-S cluster assembly iron-binding protein IscA